MRWDELADQACPVARALSVVGDRWTMLVLRDCFLGVRRFDQIQQRLGITRHVLADRLKKLEAAGVLRREVYQARPLRYEYRLTEKGKALYPVLVTLIDWANTHVPTDRKSPVTLRSKENGEPIKPRLIDANTGSEITTRAIDVDVDEDLLAG